MLSLEHQKILLQVAIDSIQSGLQKGKPLDPNLQHYPQALRQQAASFVTLEIQDDLRGCIGSLVARNALVTDVAQNSYNAAFTDPRFVALSEAEFPNLSIKISVLSPPEPLAFSSEADLLQKIRPGTDGLVLEEGNKRGTFLPAVWESLPDPNDFLMHLKKKAGLPSDYWSKTLRVKRYTTQSFP